MTVVTIVGFAVGIYVWMFGHVMLHEMSHLLAAKVVGFKAYAFIVGRGPVLLQRRMGDLDVRIHWIPSTGLVRVGPLLDGLSWKGAILTIAGPMSDALLLSVFVSLAGIGLGSPKVGEGSLFFAILAIGQAIMLVASLVPKDYTIAGTKIPSDGKQFFGYVTGRTSNTALGAYERNVRRYDPGFRIGDSWFARAEPSMLDLYVSAETNLQARRYAEGVAMFLRLVDEAGMSPGEKAYALDHLASIPIIHGEKPFLADAEAWCREACVLAPQCRTTEGSLGSVLVELGRYSEGLALLMPLTTADNEEIDRVLASCFIAKAHHGLGDRDEARKWIEVARGAGNSLGVLPRIESELNLA